MTMDRLPSPGGARSAAGAFLGIAVIAGATLILGLAWGIRLWAPPDGGRADFAVAFELMAADGRTVTETDIFGRPSLWVFGFTRCPGDCPARLRELGERLHKLGPDADRLT